MIGNLIAFLAYKASYNGANYACNGWFYQPKLPDKVKKLKKVK